MRDDLGNSPFFFYSPVMCDFVDTMNASKLVGVSDREGAVPHRGTNTTNNNHNNDNNNINTLCIISFAF